MTKRLLRQLLFSRASRSSFSWFVWGRYLAGFALLLVSYPTVWAQSSTQDLLPPKFIPKSPTVSSFARFDGQQLVNLPTGAAQLAVPLAEVSCGTLRLPVSLAYNYTGLKIGQPYDLVGLGWALQAGVSITRQVNGLVDDNYVTDQLRRYDPAQLRNGVNQPAFLKRAFESDVDTGPDLYSFSLPGGLSGRFVILDTTIVLFPQQPVHIRRMAGATYGTGFQIATEDGTRYQFQAVEVTTPNQNNFGQNSEHASAWHLTRLISTDNVDTLRLHYTPYTERLPLQCTVTTGRYFTGTYELNGNVVADDNPSAACGSKEDYPYHNVKAFPSRLRTQYLDSITARGTSLTFTYAAVSRGSGIELGHELRRVRLIATTGGRREIKRVTLFQSHFGESASPEVADYRLRLDSLRESAKGLQLPAYRFAYMGGAFPTRSSAALDYWGYANGATGNGDVTTLSAPTLLADPRLNQGQRRAADREPSFEAAVAGALQSVRYPTGGTTVWAYEPGRLRSEDELIPLSYLAGDVSTGYNAETAQSIGGKSITSSSLLILQVPQEADVTVLLHRQPHDSLATGGTNTYNDFALWRRRATGDSLLTTIQGSAYRIRDGEPTEKRYTFHLQPGTYVAQVFCELYEASTSLVIQIPYRDSTKVRLGLLGPGVRVAGTTTTAAGAPPLVHTYQYTADNRSSGISLLPEYGKGFDAYLNSNQSSIGGQGATAGTLCEFMNTSSDNRGLGNEFNKFDFYYSCVTETAGPDQGATVTYFTHQPQQFNEVVPVNVVTYRQASKSSPLRLAQQVRYTYASDSVALYPLVRVRIALSHSGDANGGADTYSPTPYEVRTAWLKPTSTEQLHYDDQGKVSTNLTRSTYERQRLIRTATRTSTGWNIQRYKRLHEYAATPAVTALRVNSFNPLIETQTWQRPLLGADSVLVAGQLTFYDPRWRSPALAYRLRIAQPLAALNQEGLRNGRYASLLSDTHYELVARVRYANGTGDLIEQQASHGPPSSFLMGYEHTLVIAEIKNASYAQVAYTSFEPTATGRWQYDSLGTHRVLGGRTGRWAYQLNGTASVNRRQLPAGDYELLYWVQSASSPTVTVQGGTQLSSPQLVATAPDNWYQFRTRLHYPTVGQVSLDVASGTPGMRLDELQLYPVGAQLTSSTHDPLIGVTSQTDPTGRTLFYEYDALGRLLRTRDEQGRILSQQQYHYAQH